MRVDCHPSLRHDAPVIVPKVGFAERGICCLSQASRKADPFGRNPGHRVVAIVAAAEGMTIPRVMVKLQLNADYMYSQVNSQNGKPHRLPLASFAPADSIDKAVPHPCRSAWPLDEEADIAAMAFFYF
jgi:hypothetical protein